jgi:hypothetical protein
MPSGAAMGGYGFVSCSTLAISDPNSALKNADNYAVFAMAISLSQIDWVESNPPGTKP